MFFVLKAVSEEIEKNTAEGNEPPCLTVSGDGTWKKRGLSLLFGLSSLIGKYAKKVLAVVVKSPFCQSWNSKKGADDFEEWFETCNKKELHFIGIYGERNLGNFLSQNFN